MLNILARFVSPSRGRSNASFPFGAAIHEGIDGRRPLNCSKNCFEAILSIRAKRLQSFVLVGILLLGSQIYSQHADGLLSSIVNVSESNGSSTSPHIATSDDGKIYLAWSDDTNSSGEIFFSVSDDEGLTFSDPLNVSNDTPTSTLPVIAVSGGNVYLVWFGAFGGESEDVYFSASTDSGESFSEPVNLSNNTGASTNPQILVLDTNMIVVWQDDDPSISSISSSAEIVYRKSTNSGLNFGEIINISQSDDHSSSPRVATSASGNIYVAWQDAGTDQTIMFSASTDGNGNSFSEPTRLSSETGFSLISNIQSAGSEDVYVSWSDFTASEDVFFASSADAGSSFSTVNVSQGNPSISTSPHFAVSPDGVIWMVWNDRQEGNGDVFIANSTDSGKTFSDGVNLSSNSFPSNFPHVAISDEGSSIYVVWQNDLDGGEKDIFFSGSTDAGGSFSSPTNVAINPELSESQVATMLGSRLLVAWTDSSPGNSELLFRVVSLDVPTITIEDISNRNPMWGTTIEVVGIASNSGTDKVTVDWGDGSENGDIEVIDNTWTSSHLYDSAGVGERTIVAKLISSEGVEDASSAPDTITVGKRESTLELLNVGSVIQGSDVIALGRLIDTESGEGIGSKELSFDGSGASNLHPVSTSTDGSFESSGGSPNSTSFLWTVQAHFDGSPEYESSDSGIRTYDTVSPFSSQFPVSTGSPVVVALTGFNATIEFDELLSGGTVYVSECEEQPVSERFLSMELCLAISSSARLERGSSAHVTISFADKEVPDGHIVDEVDMFHETVSGIVDITEARDENSETVTGTASSFSRFIVGIALHEPQTAGSARQQLYVGSDQRVVFYPLISRTVELNSTGYDPGSSASLGINDANANLDKLAIDTIIATISSTSDPIGINITLSETSMNTGLFAGLFVLSEGSSSAADARVKVDVGDELQATYVTQSDAPFEVELKEVVESGILQLSPYKVTGVTWPVIGNSYELDLIDGALGSFGAMTITMSYANVEDLNPHNPVFLIILQRNVSSLEPNTWVDITTARDTPQETVTGSSNLLSQFAITSSVFFPGPGGGGGGLPRPGTGILLDSGASIGGAIDSETDSGSGGGGGGGSRSTTITRTTSGDDVETTVRTESGTVAVQFESVKESSGQLKVEANELSVFEDFFDELAFLPQDNDEHGILRLDGSTYSTAGDVFDIDASSVNFEGDVMVTIPYDEGMVESFSKSEMDVRFLHFNEDSGFWEDKTTGVDETANTVTGTLDSLSPVTAAIIIESDTQNDMVNSITRVEVMVPTFSISTGDIMMSGNLKNTQSRDQDYVMVVQIVDSQDIVQLIDWQGGTLEEFQDMAVNFSWERMEKGTYTVQVLLLTDLENPWLLSHAVTGELNI